MSELNFSQTYLQKQAQAGDVRAIEAILGETIANPHLRFEVSRRDRTLYVFLTVPIPGMPEDYATAVYEAIATLGLNDITQLHLLDGTDAPQVYRWRQIFDLASVDQVEPTTLVESAGLVESFARVAPSDPVEAAGPVERLEPSDEVASSQAMASSEPVESVEPVEPVEPIEPIEPVASVDAVASLEPLDPLELVESSQLIEPVVIESVDSVASLEPTDPFLKSSPEAEAEGLVEEGAPPTTAIPVGLADPLPMAIREGQAGKLIALRPSRRPTRWAMLLALAALGLGLGAGVAQWHYGQRVGARPVVASTVLAPTPPESVPLTPAFVPNRFSALAASQLQAPTTITINAVGDIIPGTDYQRYRFPQDWQYLFGSIQHQLGEADLVFGNFESTLTEVPRSAKDTGRANTFAFRTPPWYASVLRAAGFDVLSVANNHSFDFGEQGFADTIANIELEGMKAVGRKGEIVYTQVKDATVAFIGFSHLSQHNTVHDLNAAAALVQEANQKADIVVVSFHAGKEGTDAVVTRDQTEYFFSENRGNVVQFSRTVIDHGADLVLGHGPHVPRALELYQNKLIAYSLGNFLGYRTLSTQGPLGVSLILNAHLNAEGDFISGRVIPVALDPNGVPYLDDHFQGVILVRSYTRRDFPNTPITIDDLGYIWRTQ